jgi:alkylhydroperoxidase/carboxymuconolactone decarboxylase family protein YurZ
MAADDLASFQQRVHGATLPGHQYLAEYDPAYFGAFRAFVGDFVYGRLDGAIPEKWRELIVLGVLAATSTWDPARVHIRRALAAGTAPREILQALEIAAVPGGMGTLIGGVTILKEELDRLGRSFDEPPPAEA